jgi:hypothetical protein
MANKYIRQFSTSLEIHIKTKIPSHPRQIGLYQENK